MPKRKIVPDGRFVFVIGHYGAARTEAIIVTIPLRPPLKGRLWTLCQWAAEARFPSVFQEIDRKRLAGELKLGDIFVYETNGTSPRYVVCVVSANEFFLPKPSKRQVVESVEIIKRLVKVLHKLNIKSVAFCGRTWMVNYEEVVSRFMRSILVDKKVNFRIYFPVPSPKTREWEKIRRLSWKINFFDRNKPPPKTEKKWIRSPNKKAIPTPHRASMKKLRGRALCDHSTRKKKKGWAFRQEVALDVLLMRIRFLRYLMQKDE